ncbi:MAG: hypothetical protein JWL90_694 [Chthoniobacteraceae bacterium]|nr:hypothetical protein [Chthoniobacteraceae bacterium]
MSPAAPSSGTVSPPASIFVIKPSSLGDVVHTLPAVALLKKHWPQSRIRWLVNPEWAPLLAANPDIDEVVLFPRSQFRGLKGLKKIVPWARAIRATHRSELVLDFQGLLRSALITRLCRAVRGRIIGLSDAREGARFFYDQVADVGGKPHAVDRYLRLAAFLGIDTAGSELQWRLPPGVPPKDPPKPGYLLLHPFSRGAGKSLSPKEVSEFCRAMAPVRVVVAGRADESVAAADNVINLLNATTLEELIWLIRNAGFVVSVDSGPMHIAAAITARLVSIHTWSDPQKVGPYSPDAWVWKEGRLFQQKKPEAARMMPDLAQLAVFLKAEAFSGKFVEHRA